MELRIDSVEGVVIGLGRRCICIDQRVDTVGLGIGWKVAL